MMISFTLVLSLHCYHLALSQHQALKHSRPTSVDSTLSLYFRGSPSLSAFSVCSLLSRGGGRSATSRLLPRRRPWRRSAAQSPATEAWIIRATRHVPRAARRASRAGCASRRASCVARHCQAVVVTGFLVRRRTVSETSLRAAPCVRVRVGAPMGDSYRSRTARRRSTPRAGALLGAVDSRSTTR